MTDTDPIAAAERIERLIDPAEFDIPPLRSPDIDTMRLYADPTHDLTDPIARHAVQDRQMSAVRAVLASYRADIVHLLAVNRAQGPGAPPVHGAVTRALNLLHDAEAEVLRAERGCGQPDGECTDPCHAGVVDAPEPDAAMSEAQARPHS